MFDKSVPAQEEKNKLLLLNLLNFYTYVKMWLLNS